MKNTEDNIGCLTFYVAIFVLVICFFAGFCIAVDFTQKGIRQDICKALYNNTKDYINCNQKNLDEIIKTLESEE